MKEKKETEQRQSKKFTSEEMQYLIVFLDLLLISLSHGKSDQVMGLFNNLQHNHLPQKKAWSMASKMHSKQKVIF